MREFESMDSADAETIDAEPIQSPESGDLLVEEPPREQLAEIVGSNLNCSHCGYEPQSRGQELIGRCPKCHGYSWQRIPLWRHHSR